MANIPPTNPPIPKSLQRNTLSISSSAKSILELANETQSRLAPVDEDFLQKRVRDAPWFRKCQQKP